MTERTRSMSSLAAQILVLALALGLRLTGLGMGLPDARHAQTYNPDEWTPLKAFEQMRPRQLDFNPHYFDNPTLFYYMVGATVGAGAATGWIRVDGDEAYYFAHPEQVGRIILLGRALAVLFGVLGVWLTYRLARAAGLERGWSTVAMLLMAVHPSHVVHSHFLTVNTAVTFWTVLAFLGMERWSRRGGMRAALLAGAAVGLAVSTKYTAVMMVPFLAAAGLARARGSAAPRGAGPAVRESLAAAGAATAAFVAGSPYILLSAHEFAARFTTFTTRHAGVGRELPLLERLAEISAWVGSVHLAASTPLLLAAAALGAVVALRHGSFLRTASVAWLALMGAASLAAGALATDSRFLPMFPFVVLLATLGLAHWHRSRPRAAVAAAAVLAIAVGAWTVFLVGRFVGPMPQRLASDWAERNLPGSERILLAGTANYWSPDLPLREYLHARNVGAYARRTRWQFVRPDTFPVPLEEARRARPDVVFLTMWLPRYREGLEWLSDPAYVVVDSFPCRLRLGRRRVHVPLDLYDVDIWVLRPRRGSQAARGVEPARTETQFAATGVRER